MSDNAKNEPRIEQIEFDKGNGGIGLSIVAAIGPNEAQHGIYIKKVVPGGAADRNGRLQAGDKLLSVNGVSLQNIMQEE